jgi:hypothetical protein
VQFADNACGACKIFAHVTWKTCNNARDRLCLRAFSARIKASFLSERVLWESVFHVKVVFVFLLSLITAGNSWFAITSYFCAIETF